MTLKFPKKVTILGSDFKVEYNKDIDGSAFYLDNSRIIIGTASLKNDPFYTFMMISHEVMEVVLQMMGARYINPRLENHYLFSFNHQTFENAIAIHAQVMREFIK